MNYSLESFELKYDLKKDYKPKEIIFVNLICELGSIERAYKDAFKVTNNKKASNAWKLYKQERIQDLLLYKRLEVLHNSNINFYAHIQKYDQIYQLCMAQGNYKQATIALNSISKLLGWDIQRVETTNNDGPLQINYIVPQKPDDQEYIDES